MPNRPRFLKPSSVLKNQKDLPQGESTLFRALEPLFVGEYLRCTPPPDISTFDYRPSPRRTERFVLPLEVARWSDPGNGPPLPPLGPIETDLLRFAERREAALLILLGGMGCGKTTTLRFIRHVARDRTHCLHIDLDEPALISVHDGSEIDAPVQNHLANRLSAALSQILDDDEADAAFLTWTLQRSNRERRSCCMFEALRLALRLNGHAVDDVSDAALRTRRRWLLESVFGRPDLLLTYFAAQLDYVLESRHAGDRSRLILVLDNLDPLPPRLQAAYLKHTKFVWYLANVTTIVALRPLTFRSTYQRANQTVFAAEHIGPDLSDLIAQRIRDLASLTEEQATERLSRHADFPGFPILVSSVDGREFPIAWRDVQTWLNAVLDAASPKGRASHDVDILGFIEGVSGYSIRSGMMLAQKLFRSYATSPLPALAAGREISLRPGDLLRALLRHDDGRYSSRPSRVIDNVFHLDRAGRPGNLTCKLRLLVALLQEPSRNLPVSGLRHFLSLFGYSDEMILSALNGCIDQVKRLCWADTHALFQSFPDADASITLAPPGEYYATTAAFLLGYVEEIHVDCFLREDSVLKHDPDNFAERMASIAKFVRFFIAEDKSETATWLANDGRRLYGEWYGPVMLSLELARRLETQVRKLASARLARSPASARHADTVLSEWQGLLNEAQHSLGEMERVIRE